MTAVNRTPLLFATSNVDKFLHARLLLGWQGHEVRRLEAHRRAYSEPYGLARAEFLRAGLTEVTARAGGSRLVFIEDTTVRIEALSPTEEDYPGQQTKEWFARTAHAELTSALDASPSRSRRVSVRSDIALYVPGLGRPVLLAGITAGVVLDEEPDIDAAAQTNLLYPWMGKRDFSSWFLPDGATKPLALLTLEESIKYDFRGKAFTQLADRLAEYEAVSRPPGLNAVQTNRPTRPDISQLVLFPAERSDLIVVVVGPPGAGKTTIGHYLALHRNFTHIEGSRALGEIAAQLGLRADSSYQLAIDLFATRGPDIVERERIGPLLSSTDGPIVYTGCRTVEGLLAMREAAAASERRFLVVHATAPPSVRLARSVERARAGAAVEPGSFAAADARDREFGLAAHAELLADATVRNSSDLKSLLARVDRLVTRAEAGTSGENQRRNRLAVLVASDPSVSTLVDTLMRIGRDLVDDELSPPLLTPRGRALVQLLILNGQSQAGGRTQAAIYSGDRFDYVGEGEDE